MSASRITSKDPRPQDTPGVAQIRVPAPVNIASLPTVETVWLGELLRAPREAAANRVRRVAPEDFSSPYTRTIYDLAQRLVVKGENPDAVRVEAEAIRLGVVPQQDRPHLAALLFDLLDMPYAPRDHAEPVTTSMLVDAAARRRLHENLTRCQQLLNEGGNDEIREHMPELLRDTWAQAQRLSTLQGPTLTAVTTTEAASA